MFAKAQMGTVAFVQSAHRITRLVSFSLKAYMLKNIFLLLIMMAINQSGFAAQLPAAGSQILQIPPPSTPQKLIPEIELERNASPVAPKTDDVKIIVNGLKVSGAQAYSENDLIALTGFNAGSELTLADLRGMALKIVDFYHRNGYFVAQAYLPVQDIKDGIVTVAVIEGRYGKVTLHNQTNLSNSLANTYLNGLKDGDLITFAPLENSLLLLSDLPGVRIKSTLTKGGSIGSSDLIVDITPEQRVTGSIDADNAGNRYTAADRIGATINLNNAAGLGDIATLRTLTSGSGLNYARASYQLQIGKMKAGVAYSSLTYALGQEFESLQANGTANIASIYGSYPLIRSRNNNLNFQLAYDAKTFQDKVNSMSIVTDKRAGVWMASLNGDHRDKVAGGGINSFSLSWAAGNIDLQTPALQSVDAATVQSNGAYGKLGFNLMRLQNVTDFTSFYAQVNGQLASKNLHVSEKMELGGMYAVRAYPEGEAYADQGYILNLETRTLLPEFSEMVSGKMQLIGFADTGTVKTNRNPWLIDQNSRTLSGAGVGLNWIGANNFVLKTFYAWKLGSETATSAPDKTGRFWIQGVKYF
jgi:hemolysin activation/secretion protein